MSCFGSSHCHKWHADVLVKECSLDLGTVSIARQTNVPSTYCYSSCYVFPAQPRSHTETLGDCKKHFDFVKCLQPRH